MKNLKKVFKILFTILILVTILLMITFIFKINFSIADVGSFESYGGGSSSSSSSSGSYGGSSSYGGYGSSSYDSDSSSGGSVFGSIIIFAIIIGVAFIINKYKQPGIPNMNFDSSIMNQGKDEQTVENEVKATDELFNKEEFYSWAKDLFVKLQAAWTARDWSTIRVFETNELFEQHKQQLQGYIDNNQINMMERVCVLSTRLSDFRQVGDKDEIDVILKSQMVDYIIDATSKELLKGSKDELKHGTYKLTFIRKTGVKTKPGTSEVNTTNCPNCGAPTQITSAGKCEYCGSVITTGEYNWVLSSLQRIM